MEITVRDVAVHHYQSVCRMINNVKEELAEIMKDKEDVTLPGKLVCRTKKGRAVYHIFCGLPVDSHYSAGKLYAAYEGLRQQARIWQRALSSWKPVEECPDHMSHNAWKRLGDAAWRRRVKVEAKLKNGCYKHVRTWKEKRAERQQMAAANSGREPVTV